MATTFGVDPFSLAEVIEEAAIPWMLGGQSYEHITPEVEHALGDLATRNDALRAAVEVFEPPSELPGAAEAFAALVGTVSLRANTPEFLDQFPDVHERYSKASSWVCTNFGKLIWWDCD